MDIFEYRLDQLAGKFKSRYGKGLYHAAALYREVFKSGNRSPLQSPEFIASPRFSKQLETKIRIRPGTITDRFKDGELTKFITRLSDGEQIESVIIPMTGRNTLCVSSQVGCRMGCRFCQTGQMGFRRNLSVAEIIGQLYNARFVLKSPIKNIVFMGMGEPLDNLENVIQAIRMMNEQKGFDIALRHITVSTAGVADGIEALAEKNLKGLRLAVSINSAFNEVRSRLMPVNNRTPLEMLKTALGRFPLGKRGCFLFEYILIKGFNDREKDAIKLAEYINPLPVRLNLIAYNPIDAFNYETPDDENMIRFAQLLSRQGVFVVKRWSKGRSVSAGCGQLGKDISVPTEQGI